jgi:hypothetical protein
MWWGLSAIGVALAAFALEMIERQWLDRKADRDLGLMRTRMRSGHVWDAQRGSWRA